MPMLVLSPNGTDKSPVFRGRGNAMLSSSTDTQEHILDGRVQIHEKDEGRHRKARRLSSVVVSDEIQRLQHVLDLQKEQEGTLRVAETSSTKTKPQSPSTEVMSYFSTEDEETEDSSSEPESQDSIPPESQVAHLPAAVLLPTNNPSTSICV